jgi:hypothetical protein
VTVVLSASLAEDSDLGVGSRSAWASAEILEGLSVLWSSEEEGVGSCKILRLNTLIKFK